MKTQIIIPARYASSRLPAKPLLAIHDQPMIVWTAQRAAKAVETNIADAYCVATDHLDIAALCQQHDIPCIMTDPDHASGTDRLGQVAEILNLAADDLVLNVQGDEPLVPTTLLLQLKQLLLAKPDCVMATLCEPICDDAEFARPSVVKVVANAQQEALYFSRSPIPHNRDNPAKPIHAYRHLGMYGYRVRLLQEFKKWSVGTLEQLESLEQLRVLENGHKIAIDIAHVSLPAGVDTPEDLRRLNQMPLAQLLALVQ